MRTVSLKPFFPKALSIALSIFAFSIRAFFNHFLSKNLLIIKAKVAPVDEAINITSIDIKRPGRLPYS